MLTILHGDCREKLKELPDGIVNCCVTSPPYFGLRSYLKDDDPNKAREIGMERTPDEYVAELVSVFREVRRTLRDDGTLWCNLGDSYAQSETRHRNKECESSTLSDSRGKWSAGVAQTGRKLTHGLKNKDLMGIPWRVAFALQADGWYLRQDIIWSKRNPMPESVTDRCTKSHEYIFLLAKSERYYYDADAIKEPASSAGKVPGGNKSVDASRGDASRDMSITVAEFRNRRSVWTVATRGFDGAHFATFPPELIKPCILAGCPPGGVALDPFGGSGTTGKVALELGRQAILIELNKEYLPLLNQRTTVTLGLPFAA